MATIKLKAFVHHLENAAQGFIYGQLFTENGSRYVRISSANEEGLVHVFEFGRKVEMLAEASAQSRLNPDFVTADETTLEVLNFASKRMLIDKLREQHSYLFFQERMAAC